MLVEVIPIHLVLEQLPPQFGHAAVGLFIPHPHAVRWIVKTHLRRRTPDGHQIPRPVRVPLEHGRLRRHGCHPAAPSRQADLQRVDSPHHLIIQLELAVDAQSAGRFGPDLGPAEQVRRRRRQLGEVVVLVPGPVRNMHPAWHKLAQVVDARNLDVPHVSEVVALVPYMVLGQVQPQRLLLVVQVDQVFHVVSRAPLRLHPEEILAEHPAPDVPVVRLGAPGLIGHLGSEQERQVLLKVVALLLPELVEQPGRPRHETGVVGFVAEEAQNGLAELIPYRLLVGFVGDLEESPGGIRIQIVDQRVLAVFGARAVRPRRHARGRTAKNMPDQDQLPRLRVAARARRRRRGPPMNSVRADRHNLTRAGLRKHRQRAQSIGRRWHGQRLARHRVDPYVRVEPLHGQLGVLLADLAARKPAGVVVFVLDPQLHPALLGFLNYKLHLVHVLRREVLGLAAPRRHVHHENAIGRQPVEILDDSCPNFTWVGAVPTLERLNGAVFARRRFEVPGGLGQRRNRDLLPRPLRRQRGGQQRNQSKHTRNPFHRNLP